MNNIFIFIVYNNTMKLHITFFLLIIAATANNIAAQENWTYDSGGNIFSRIKYLEMRDSVRLEITEFIQDTTESAKRPCILYCTGYGESLPSEVSSLTARYSATNGFYTVTYRMRGQGLSDGVSELISRTEMKDLFEVINYIKNGIYANPERIAIVGSSQGGIISLMACSNGLKVTCIISDLMSPDFASDWIIKGSIKMTLLWSLGYEDFKVRYSDKVKKYREWILKSDEGLFDSLNAELPPERDFSGLIGNCTVPVLITNAWGDLFFSSNSIIKSIPSFSCERRVFLGPINGHGSSSYKEAEIYHNELIQSWLSHYLKGDDKSLSDSTYSFSMSYFNDKLLRKYFMISSKNNPFVLAKNFNLFLDRDNRLSRKSSAENEKYYILSNNIKDSSLTLEKSVNLEFKGAEFDSGFVRDSIVLRSEPLENDYSFAGIPYAEMYYSSDNNTCQFNIKIFEQTSSGNNIFITSINFTDRKAGLNTIKNITAEGNSFAHKFSEDSRIKVVINNLDTRPGNKFLRSNPFVLPVMKNFKGKLYFGKNYPSRLILPLLEYK